MLRTLAFFLITLTLGTSVNCSSCENSIDGDYATYGTLNGAGANELRIEVSGATNINMISVWSAGACQLRLYQYYQGEFIRETDITTPRNGLIGRSDSGPFVRIDAIGIYNNNSGACNIYEVQTTETGAATSSLFTFGTPRVWLAQVIQDFTNAPLIVSIVISLIALAIAYRTTKALFEVIGFKPSVGRRLRNSIEWHGTAYGDIDPDENPYALSDQLPSDRVTDKWDRMATRKQYEDMD